MGVDQLPALAGIIARPQAARGRAHGEPDAGLVDVEGMAVDQVVSVLLRQTLAEGLPGLAAVLRASHGERAVARQPHLVLDRGHEPGGAGLARMRRDREAEIVAGRLELRPRNAGVAR